VDLGQFSSFSAACVLRRTALHGGDGRPERTSTGAVLCRFDVMALRRYARGTAYIDVVSHVVGQALRPELRADRPLRGGQPLRICVDATGVGVPVMEMFRKAARPHPSLELWGATITSGRTVTQPGPGAIVAAKQEIAGCLRSVLETGRLGVPSELEFAGVLRRELGDFTVRVTSSANEVYEAGAGQFDDLAMCVAIPVFVSTWLDDRTVPVLAGPGPPVFPNGYRSGSYASTFGGLFRPSRPPPLEGAGRRPYDRERLFGRGPSGR
jgi:hypothetical protein